MAAEKCFNPLSSRSSASLNKLGEILNEPKFQSAFIAVVCLTHKRPALLEGFAFQSAFIAVVCLTVEPDCIFRDIN